MPFGIAFAVLCSAAREATCSEVECATSHIEDDPFG
jgi:hypothetical protein